MVTLDAPVKQASPGKVTMFEVLRTNDPVLLSFAASVLDDAGIASFTADTNMSILDGSLIAIPRRLLVAAEDGEHAKATLDRALKAAEEAGPLPDDDGTTDDAFLGGRLTVRQPERGFRAGMDSVMLAAAVSARAGEDVLELGSGAGIAALCLAVRVDGIHVVGLEVQPELVDLAASNAHANNLHDRAHFIAADLASPPETLRPNSFDHVMMNPPFFVEGRDDAPPDAARATAHIADAEALARWTKCARIYLRAKGTLTAILPADRLPDMLAALEKGFGGIAVTPLWPDAAAPAKRVLVAAKRDSRAPFTLKPGLVLHENGSNTPAAEAILRGGAAL